MWRQSQAFNFARRFFFCLHAMQTRPWMSKDICLCKLLLLHGVSLTLAELCMRWRLTKGALFSGFSESWNWFMRILPQIPVSDFHIREQAEWNCLSALQEGELELMLWKCAVAFPWNRVIFNLQHFDVYFENKQANAISISLQFWCFSKWSLFSLGWHTRSANPRRPAMLW